MVKSATYAIPALNRVELARSILPIRFNPEKMSRIRSVLTIGITGSKHMTSNLTNMFG